MDCSQYSLLITDPDVRARDILAMQLAADGFEINFAPSQKSATQLLESCALDLLIVRPDLPDGDGLDLVRILRASGPGAACDALMPVLLLSDSDLELDRLRAFEAGVDDVVTLPYWYPELRARVRALTRRQHGRRRDGGRLRVGPLELDPLARQAWLRGQPLPLASKEFSLLRLLAAEPERVYTREELLRAVWGWDVGSATRTVDTHVCRLRRKLGPGYVINVWGVGYRLVDAASIPLAA